MRKRKCSESLADQVNRKRQTAASRTETDSTVEPGETAEQIVLSSGTDEEQAGTSASRSIRRNNTVDFRSILADDLDCLHGCGGETDPVSSNSSAEFSAHSLFSMAHEIEPNRCVGDDLSIHIPIKLVRQIQGGDYINLALMLKGAVELTDFCRGTTLRLGENGVLESKVNTCKDKLSSIERWTDAFIVYMSVYLKKYPGKAGEMLQYMSLIRECSRRQGGYAWRSYDEQFRLRQSMFPSSWSAVNQDLWLRCMSTRDISNDPLVVQKPIGKCFEYNKGHCPWPSCKYSHSCTACGQAHPHIYCPSSMLDKPFNGYNSWQNNVQSNRGINRQGNNSFRSRGRGFRFNRHFTRGPYYRK